MALEKLKNKITRYWSNPQRIV